MSRTESLVLELERKAFSNETRVSELLRMALVVARKLDIGEFAAKAFRGGKRPSSSNGSSHTKVAAGGRRPSRSSSKPA
jgi:hypothetical protein